MQHENPANRFARRKRDSLNRFPAANGTSSLGPGKALRFALDYQTFFCVRIELLEGDPNDNGGRDSNGYYKCFVENDRWGPTDPRPVEMRVNPDGNSPLTSMGRIWAYAYSRTADSPDSGDDGFTLLRPIVSGGGNFLSEVNNLGSAPSYAIPGPVTLFSPVAIPDSGSYLATVSMSVAQNFAGSVTAAEPDAIDVGIAPTGTASVAPSLFGPGAVRVGYFAVPTYTLGAGPTLNAAWNYEDMGWQFLTVVYLVAGGQQGETIGFEIGGMPVNGTGNSVKALAARTMTKIDASQPF